MKITLHQPKPRNPLVALARARRAGTHQANRAGQRRQANRALKRELDQMKQSP